MKNLLFYTSDEWSCALRRSAVAMPVDAAEISANLHSSAFLAPSSVTPEPAP